MSPLNETVLEQRPYRLRLIGPRAAVFATSPAPTRTLLARTDMVARDLPLSNVPNSPDFASGSYNLRLMDAGDAQLTFPNKEASDGVPWRYRFDPAGRLQWVEVWLDEHLESVFAIEKLELARDHVTISGHDGLYATRSAYERDWIVVQAPRDVIERGTRVWVPVVADDFPAGSLNPQWSTAGTQFGGVVAIGPAGSAFLSATSTANSAARISASGAVVASGAWSARVDVSALVLGAASNFTFQVEESTGDFYSITVMAKEAAFVGGSGLVGFSPNIPLAPAPRYSLLIESDGEWVSGYLNGALLGGMRRASATTTSLDVFAQVAGVGAAASATVTGALVEVLQPFLQRGADRGDYVLPGSAMTYPVGGLHARYFNNADLQSDAERLALIHHPSRTQAYVGSGASEYQNRQDAQIIGQAPPTPGVPVGTVNPVGWSCIWFGAIYLKLSAGGYIFQVTLPPNTSGWCSSAVRVWVGQTQFGEQIIDEWAWAGGAAYSATVAPADLAGALPFGAGVVARDGWYPIKIEYAVDADGPAGAPTPEFQWFPPASYTDPGGTAITSAWADVPASSLSPLGMVDNRNQGVSHFDLIQKTAIGFGYQIAVEPYSLESGLFPGVLAPRVREGLDTDAILEPDDSQRREGIVDYGQSLDATDTATSMIGNGAGFQNGNSGQLQALVYDPIALGAALFDLQGWEDASDVSFASLLDQVLNSKLGLRLFPWQTITAQPQGRPRLAFSWPITGALAQQRWRPGDGMRVVALDVNIEDVAPRQLWLVTRAITPLGVQQTTVGFASLPARTDVNYGMGAVRARSPHAAVREALVRANRWQRNYQRQLTTLAGNLVFVNLAPVTDGDPSIVLPLGADQIVRAYLRVSVNASGVAYSVKVNGTDETLTLGGPWSLVPLNLSALPVSALDQYGQLTAVVRNNDAAVASVFAYQLLLDVLR